MICFTAPSNTPCSYARTRIRRRCTESAAFLARGVDAGAATAESVFLTVFFARGARFLATFSAVIEPEEYSPKPQKTQHRKTTGVSLRRPRLFLSPHNQVIPHR